jgi:excisionase family DNA binding protein
MITIGQKAAAEDTRSRLFTIRQVADLAGVSMMTVRRWIDDHGLRVHRIGRRVVRISQADLNTFFSTTRPHNDSK